ncbi:MAG: M48 family metalloprotease [Candidatus Pacearchaeota archaeon]
MKKFIFRLVTFYIIVCFFVTSLSCAVNPVTGKKQLMLLSEQDELNLGNSVFPNAIWGSEGGGGEYKDEKLRGYLESIVNRIHQISHRPYIPCRFYIQNSSIPNAWALPGHVAITRGLLAELNNEAEFAFIIGHEIGHVSARHSASHVSHNILMQAGLAVLGLSLEGKEYSDLILGVGVISSALLLLKYSRDDELEADRLGVLYMNKVGYDPSYAVEAHKTLQKAVYEYKLSIGESPDDEVIFGDILSTHPRTRVRIDEIERLITTSTKYQIFGDGVGRDYFQYMISDLKRVNKIYRNYYDKAVREFKRKNLYEAERLLKIALQHDTTQPPFYALYGFIHLQYKNDYEAEKYFNYALSLQNNYQPAFRGLGIINYKRNNYYGTIEILNRALRLFPEDINSMYYLGMTYYKIKDFSKALSHMTKFAQSRPDHPEINGYIGICYEKIGDIYSAYNSYKRQVEIDSTNEIGRYSYQRAIELKKIIDLEKEKEKQKKKKKGKENK